MSEWLNDVKTAYKYAEDVKSGKVIAGQYVRLAVDRWYSDILLAESKGFYWDEVAAQKALGFFELLCFTKGRWKGKPFKLEPWQCFIVANIFGWKRKSTRKRRFTEAYVEIPKKNGKTELAAGIALYMLIMDGEPGAEVYVAAYTRDQASICFKAAKSMANQSPHIKRRLQIQTYNLYHEPSESVMMAVSHDANNTEGKNPHCVPFDEYHVHKTDDVKTSLRSGQAAREQPLFFTITTAGANLQGPCYKHRRDCINILKGITALEDQFTIIFGLDEGDDWKNPEIWRKANPNYDISVRPEFLMGEFQRALENGRAEVEFKTKHLNVWMNADKTWIRSEVWEAMADQSFVPPKGAIWFGGIDLGATEDMSAFSQYFPEYNFLRTRYYVSEKAAEYATTASGIDYKQWIKDGYLIATPGDTTDYGYILRDIERDLEQYVAAMVGFDVARSTYFQDALKDVLGLIYAGEKKDDGEVKYEYRERLQPFPQRIMYFNSPTRKFEEMCAQGAFRHDGNPISGWQLSNVSLIKDSNDNIRPAKNKSKGKVDGIIAKLMAIGEHEIWGKYIENEQGLLVV